MIFGDENATNKKKRNLDASECLCVCLQREEDIINEWFIFQKKTTERELFSACCHRSLEPVQAPKK